MTKVNWGLKRQCVGCSSRFYDLGKNPASCPKCKTSNDINAPVKTRRGRAKATVEVAADDPLLKEKARAEGKQKVKKPVVAKEIDDVDLEEFEDIETIDAEEEIEEIADDVEDIESLEELEDIEATGTDDEEIEIEDEAGDGAIIDGIDDEEEMDDDEEEDGKSSKRGAKPVAKGKKTLPVKAKKKAKK